MKDFTADANYANGGKGALIAVAVVPSGDQALFSGLVGGDQGAPVALPPVPEPSLTWLLGVVAPLLVRRRRSGFGIS